MTASEVIDLPQPDSPTSAMVSPGRTEKETSSTTATSPWRGKRMDRLRTSSRGSASPSYTGRSVRADSAARSVARREARGTARPTCGTSGSTSGTTGSDSARRASSAVSTGSSASIAVSSAATAASSESVARAFAGVARVARGAATMASVMPSERMLRHRTVSMMARPGKNVAHQ
ncbi:Uncharacterised protein [Mycobacteroides abscessus]|nr:Uncharacterised protein [Mycobacteroides abscessus]